MHFPVMFINLALSMFIPMKGADFFPYLGDRV